MESLNGYDVNLSTQFFKVGGISSEVNEEIIEKTTSISCNGHKFQKHMKVQDVENMN